MALRATALFLVLLSIEFVDLVFAVEPVLAIFAISTGPASCAPATSPAIIGSGTLYFALAAMLHRFSYFEYALAAVPVYIGTRIFLVGAVGRFPGDLARGDLLADHR